jgi:8-oxo-dGTP pyrophosphatase MutT (NUDIX family)
MSAGVRDNGDSGLPAGWSRTPQPSAKFFRLAHLRKLRRCEKVAAVCYRVRRGDIECKNIEFLLVKTRSNGRWTFPKGSAEPGLTHAQAAALEAFEEAGVHGRMEETSFTRYFRRKRGDTRDSAARSSQKQLAVNVHLCEVLRLSAPQEFDRNPTWFSAEKAKQRLWQDRTPDFGAELARVVDRAVTRIRRLRSATSPAIEGHLAGPRLGGPRFDGPRKDALQKVRFIDDARGTAGRAKASGIGGSNR